MDEPIQTEPLVQRTKEMHSQSLLSRIHKKLALVVLVSLFFLVFGVGTFYTSQQFTNRSSILSPTPTIVQTSTITPIISNQPTVSTYPWEKSTCGNKLCEQCESNQECCNYPCKDGVCPPPTCLGNCPQDCKTPIPTESQSASPTEPALRCSSDSTCSNQCERCINGVCMVVDGCNPQELQQCNSDSDCPARQGCYLYQCFSGECRKIDMCNEE